MLSLSDREIWWGFLCWLNSQSTLNAGFNPGSYLPCYLVKLYSERETDRGEESYPVVSHEGGYIWRLEPNLLFDTTKVNIGNFQQKILPQFKKKCIIFLVFVVSALQHYHWSSLCSTRTVSIALRFPLKLSNVISWWYHQK